MNPLEIDALAPKAAKAPNRADILSALISSIGLTLLALYAGFIIYKHF